VFDVLTIAAVADELSETLLDGRIQRIGLVDPRTVAAEVYAGGRRRYLVASADDRAARIGLVAALPSLDAELVTPFGLLLRKYARGGVLVGVDQPPLERLIRLSIAKRLQPARGGEREPDEEIDAPEAEGDGEIEATYVHLAVEIMGRHSNLILVDDEGRVMESAKRVTAAMSRVRHVLPKLPYVPPPPLDRPDPRRLTAAGATALVAAEPGDAELAALLVRRLRGISPQMAREIAFRAAGNAGATIGDIGEEGAAAVARETRALLEPLLTSAWAPRVYRERPHPADPLAREGGSTAAVDAAEPSSPQDWVPAPRVGGAVVAFSAVPMAHLAAIHIEEAVASISAAAESAAAEAAAGGRHAQRRERLLAAIRAARAKQERRLRAVREQGAKAAAAETLRASGELIYAYLWQIQPGQAELAVDGATVPLDPALGAKENAQAYFERYRKAQGAGAQAPELAAAIEAEIAYLDQVTVQLEQAAGFAEIEALTAEWEAHAGTAPAPGRPRRRPEPKRPRPLLDAAGNAVYVGRSGAQNDLITFDLAGPNDTWLHARGVPGSHVVVRWHQPGGEEDPGTIAAAAALAAFYSSARGSASVDVDVTRRRHVRKIKGTGPGMVTYRQERTIAVRPVDEAGVAAFLRPTGDRPTTAQTAADA